MSPKPECLQTRATLSTSSIGSWTPGKGEGRIETNSGLELGAKMEQFLRMILGSRVQGLGSRVQGLGDSSPA